MKLYTSHGPNPKTVTAFLAEKGLTLPFEKVDIGSGANRRAEYLAINPTGTTPALLLDSGMVISEITVICEYLEELHPSPSLFGTTPEQRAETRMWTRRIDLAILEPMLNGYRHGEGRAYFEGKIRVIPEASAGLKAVAHDGLVWLDGQMAGKSWICGARYSFADIILFAFVDFIGKVGAPIDPTLATLAAWQGRMRERPGFKR